METFPATTNLSLPCVEMSLPSAVGTVHLTKATCLADPQHLHLQLQFVPVSSPATLTRTQVFQVLKSFLRHLEENSENATQEEKEFNNRTRWLSRWLLRNPRLAMKMMMINRSQERFQGCNCGVSKSDIIWFFNLIISFLLIGDWRHTKPGAHPLTSGQLEKFIRKKLALCFSCGYSNDDPATVARHYDGADWGHNCKQDDAEPNFYVLPSVNLIAKSIVEGKWQSYDPFEWRGWNFEIVLAASEELRVQQNEWFEKTFNEKVYDNNIICFFTTNSVFDNPNK